MSCTTYPPVSSKAYAWPNDRVGRSDSSSKPVQKVDREGQLMWESQPVVSKPPSIIHRIATDASPSLAKRDVDIEAPAESSNPWFRLMARSTT